MTKLLLTIHVLAAIIAIGPVTVAASMFPAAARRADHRTLQTLHRITRVYATLAIVVPVFGLATAQSLGVLTDPWLLISIALTALAAALLTLQILPRQSHLLTTTWPAAAAGPLSGTPHPAAFVDTAQRDADPSGAQHYPAVMPPRLPTAAETRPDASPPPAARTQPDASPRPAAGTQPSATQLPGAPTTTGIQPGAPLPSAERRPDPARLSQLGALTGVFNLLWAIVVVLMIIRPGSTTGA